MLGLGKAFTVTFCVVVLVHPLPFVTVYVIKLVPALTGVITPVASIVATPVVPLVHAPPTVVLEYVVVEPIHIEVVE